MDSFVARIWLEHGPEGETIWRGHIRQVHGEQQAYFQDLADMKAFLERVTGIPGPDLTEPPVADAADAEPGLPRSDKRLD